MESASSTNRSKRVSPSCTRDKSFVAVLRASLSTPYPTRSLCNLNRPWTPNAASLSVCSLVATRSLASRLCGTRQEAKKQNTEQSEATGSDWLAPREREACAPQASSPLFWILGVNKPICLRGAGHASKSDVQQRNRAKPAAQVQFHAANPLSTFRVGVALLASRAAGDGARS